jgi:two-component system phosphate regulon response regulator PhoB
MLRVSLEIEGYEVADAPDGKTALERAAARRPELLILDYVLPDTDGLQLLAEIRARLGAPELPAIVVTGMVSRLEELRARAGANTELVAKPIEPSAPARDRPRATRARRGAGERTPDPDRRR